MRQSKPQYRVRVREFRGRTFHQAFVVHTDGARTAIDV